MQNRQLGTKINDVAIHFGKVACQKNKFDTPKTYWAIQCNISRNRRRMKEDSLT